MKSGLKIKILMTNNYKKMTKKIDYDNSFDDYEKYLKLEYEKEKYNNFIKELQG